MLALAVLACVLALRIFVPEGWMPVSDAHGFRIMMCSGTGPMEMPMAMPGMAMHHNSHDEQQPTQDHPCTFAHLGLAFAEPVLPALDLPLVREAETVADRTFTVAIGQGLAAPPPPSTGPPLFA